jgi:serine/threonine protein kinase
VDLETVSDQSCFLRTAVGLSFSIVMLTCCASFSFLTIIQGRNVKTGELVALKEIVIDREEGTPSTAIREITLMKALSGNPNILSLLDVTHTNDTLTLVFEFCKGDLKKFMDTYKIPTTTGKWIPAPLPVEVVRDLTYQMLKGIAILHENHIIHRDLKVYLHAICITARD